VGRCRGRISGTFLVLSAELLVHSETKLPTYLNTKPAEIAYFILQIAWPPIFLVLVAIVRNR
jgi:hypothetical protein